MLLLLYTYILCVQLGFRCVSCNSVCWRAGESSADSNSSHLAAESEKSSNASWISLSRKWFTEEWESVPSTAKRTQVSTAYLLTILIFALLLIRISVRAESCSDAAFLGWILCKPFQVPAWLSYLLSTESQIFISVLTQMLPLNLAVLSRTLQLSLLLI